MTSNWPNPERPGVPMFPERAVSACLSQKEVFTSPEYAGGRIGAIMERFACDQCIEAIRNLGAAP